MSKAERALNERNKVIDAIGTAGIAAGEVTEGGIDMTNNTADFTYVTLEGRRYEVTVKELDEPAAHYLT
jgi:hypothetical protein